MGFECHALWGEGGGVSLAEVIISGPLGLLSRPHERKRLMPLSLGIAVRAPLCVGIVVAHGCVWKIGLPAEIQNHLLFSSTNHSPTLTPAVSMLTQRASHLGKHC